MGSLTSRPSVPRYQQPQIKRVPVIQSAPAAPVQPTAAAASEVKPSQVDATEQAADLPRRNDTTTGSDASSVTPPLGDQDTRDRNLLSRSRGRLSTIRTGFKGALLQPTSARPIKTLLGE